MKNIINILKGVVYVVVHGGSSHLDEFMATAMYLAIRAMDNFGKIDPVKISRRDPTADEIRDPSVLVMDVGGVYNPEWLSFDHHQFERGTKESAMGLVASWAGIRDVVAKLCPWFETRISVDAIGPFATAKAEGVEWSTVAKFLGPCEELILKQFEDASDDDRWQVVAPLARSIAGKFRAFDEVQAALVENEIGGVEVYDFTNADPLMTREVSDALVRDKGVAVFHDDRGAGLTLLRVNDDPRIDFSRVDGDPAVVFAHKGGFICKTLTKDMKDAERLIGMSIKA